MKCISQLFVAVLAFYTLNPTDATCQYDCESDTFQEFQWQFQNSSLVSVRLNNGSDLSQARIGFVDPVSVDPDSIDTQPWYVRRDCKRGVNMIQHDLSINQTMCLTRLINSTAITFEDCKTKNDSLVFHRRFEWKFEKVNATEPGVIIRWGTNPELCLAPSLRGDRDIKIGLCSKPLVFDARGFDDLETRLCKNQTES